MVDITSKSNTLRTAVAQAKVCVGHIDTITAIKEDKVPKGNVFEMSNAAGLLGVKKTPELLPDCHPIPIEYTGFEYEIDGLTIIIRCTVKTIYKTGVEVEAMHGASIAALNMYDMLKPLDKNVSIEQIALLSKTGGKSNLPKVPAGLNAAVIVCSDSVSAGNGKDTSGVNIRTILKDYGLTISQYEVISDDLEGIQSKASELVEANVDVIVFVGGTGASPRDNTPEALVPLFTKRLYGVEETMRNYGQNRTPVAMFSRSVAGICKESLLLGIPGSNKGSVESIQSIFPSILHVFDVIKGQRHS